MRNSRFRNRLYTIEKPKKVDGRFQYVRNEDGTLFSGTHKTKIKPEDLPKWYLCGRYYKRWGYLSTNGITSMLYIPNRHTNHFLKDDCLLIAYGGQIEPNPEATTNPWAEKYIGWDEQVWGSEIITVLKGARKYSDFDIMPFIAALKEKLSWLQAEYPNGFEREWWDDLDAMLLQED